MGDYKNGVGIIVTYQAVNSATGKTVTMDIYDEAHAKDVAKCVAAMTEIGATGRYYATYTPDAEGEWIALMTNTTDGNGDVVKAFNIIGHNVDSIGDAVATVDTVVDGIKAVTDVESGVKAAVYALNNFDPALDAVATVTALTGHTAQTGDNFALANGAAGFVAIDTVVDGIKAVTDVESGVKADVGTVDTVVDGIQTDLSNATDGLGAIKTAVDAVGSPAMVG